ncbi:MAG: hypothetical protein ACYDD4_03695 [Acidimicrobiales bacterium]
MEPKQYHRYMFVSKEQYRFERIQDEGLSWLQRELAWEAVLAGLRAQAGIVPATPAVAAHGSQSEVRPAA